MTLPFSSRKNTLRRYLEFSMFAFIISTFIIGMLFNARFTGMLTAGENIDSINVSQTYDENSEVILNMKGNVTSVRVTGLFIGNGTGRILLDDVVIVDSEKLIDETNTDSITGLVVDEIAPSDVADELNESVTEKLEPANDSEEIDISQNIFVIQMNDTPDNLTEDENITTIAREDETEKLIIKEFTSYCLDTCSISLPKDIILTIELKDMELNLTSIEYTYLEDINDSVEEINEIVEVAENITNITSDIITDSNVTEIPVIEETPDLSIETAIIHESYSAVSVDEPVIWVISINTTKSNESILPKDAYNITTDSEILIDTGNSNYNIEDFNDVANYNRIINELKDLEKTVPKEEAIEVFNQVTELINEISVLDVDEDAEYDNVTLRFLNPVSETVSVTYLLPGPKKVEEDIGDFKKRITVSSDAHYLNVHSYASIQESAEKNIRLYWVKDTGKEVVENAIYVDTNDNGLIDRVEWTIPHLSNQTFEIILITNADHLDENREIIESIYDDVKDKDNIWSPFIYHNQFVRVTFERKLTSLNDITIYARDTQNLSSKIEVYAENSSELIAEFPVIDDEKYYKIYLTGMPGEVDTFDLKIVNLYNSSNASIEIDNIIDPAPSSIYAYGAEDLNEFTNNYTMSPYSSTNYIWKREAGRSRTGTYAFNYSSNTSSLQWNISYGSTFNLTQYDSCTLEAYAQALNAVDGGEYVCIRISADGGTTWLRNSGGGSGSANLNDECVDGAVDTENSYQRLQLYIAGSNLSQNFTFKLSATSNVANENFVVDDIYLNCTRFANATLNNPQNGNVSIPNGTVILNVTYLQPQGLSGTVKFVNYSNNAIWCTNSSLSNNSQVTCAINVGMRDRIYWYANASITNSYDNPHGRWYFASGLTPPTQDTPSISPTYPNMTSNLTCNWNNVQDAEGDSVVNITNWYKNNKSITLLYMPFEGVNGNEASNATDYSGYGNNGTINNGAVWNRTGGKVGGAYRFDGNNDYIFVEDTTLTDLNKNITIEAWIKIHAYPACCVANILIKNYAGGGEYALGYGNDYFGFDYVDDLGISHSYLTAASPFTLNSWHHIAFTYTYGNNNSARIYVNGTLLSASWVTGNGSMNITPEGSHLSIGSRLGSGTINATLDEFKIYNMTLSGSQILQNYQLGALGKSANIIVKNETSLYDEWVCSATPNDGYSDGIIANSSAVTIANEPPYQDIPTITPSSPNPTSNLTCNWNNVQDAEGDIVVNITNWYRNSQSITALYLPFEGNRNEDNTAKDYSGYNNNGTVSGAAWSRTTGKVGGGYYFDGIDDVIITPDSISLSSSGNFTVEGWFKLNDTYNLSTADYVYGIMDKGDYQIFLANYDGKLYWVVNENATKNISWPSNLGLSSNVLSFAVWDGNLYVGGQFNNAGGDPDADRIARWNGTNYSWPSDQGLNGNVNSLIVWNGELYVGGAFTDAGGDIDADSIAKWNGTNFSWSGPNLSNFVNSFGIWNDNLYLIGRFVNASEDDDADRIAMWNGTNFSWPSGQGLTECGTCDAHSLTVWNGNLYVGGRFTNAGGDQDADRIAMWNGTNFSWPSGQGLSGSWTNSLAVWNGELYVGGVFSDAGDDIDADDIAKWNGTNFSWPSGQNISTEVFSFAVWNGDLYVGGNFDDAGGDTDADNIAMWNGTSFSWPSNLAITSDVNSIGVWNGDLYLGGGFSNAAGDGDADSIAKYGTNNNKSVSSITSSWDKDSWYHFTGTHDGSNMALYINGVAESTIATNISIEQGDKDLYIGKMHGGQVDGSNFGGSISGELFKGWLDELKIFNHSLSTSQIYQNYLAGNANRTSNILVFNETSLNDEWVCSATPNDGHSDGFTMNSSAVTITSSNTAPSVTALSFSPP